MRIAASWLFLLIGGWFAMIALVLPLMLMRQATENQKYYAQLENIAKFYRVNGQLPTADSLQKSKYLVHDTLFWSSLSTMPVDCNPSFLKMEADQAVFSFWRGEWWECYAFPSGRTTLHRTVRSYFSTTLLMYLANFLIAAGAIWSGIRLRRN